MGDAPLERERDGEGEVVAGGTGAGEAAGESGAAVASGAAFVSLAVSFFLAEEAVFFLAWGGEKQPTFV